MSRERISSGSNKGKVREEPRLFPDKEKSREDPSSDTPPHEAAGGPAPVDSTRKASMAKSQSVDLRRNVRAYIALACLLPPVLSVLLLRFQGIYNAPDVALVAQRFGLAFVAICTLAASFLIPRYIERIARTVTDAANPDTVNWQSIQTRLKWFLRTLVVAFAVYYLAAPIIANIVLANVAGKPFTVDSHVFALLATAPAVIIVGVPIFFRLSDLIGTYFAARGGAFVFVSVGAKVAALGLSTPVMVIAALATYFRDRTGGFSTEAITVCVVLLIAAGTGTYIAWNSFRRSLAPLRTISIDGAITDQPKTTASELTPHSLDELGLLVRGWTELAARDQVHHLQIRRKDEHIRLIADSLPVLIAYVDSDERFQFVNELYREWWRIEPEEIIGKSLSEFLPPELYAEKAPCVAAALAGIECSDITEFTYPDGKWRICEIRYVPHKSDTGPVRGYFALVSDITERKQAELAAQKAHQRLLDAIECLPAGFTLYDRDERLVISNSHRRDLTSWHGDLLAPGVKYADLLRDSATKGTIKGVDKHDATAIETLVAQRLEAFHAAEGIPIEWERSDGTALITLFHKTSDGGTVSISVDITERKHAEQAAQIADRRLHDAIESLPAGFSLYDKDERLVITNSRRQALTHWHGDLVAAGVTFETLVSESVARGAISDVDKDNAGQCEQYVAHRLEEFRRATGQPFEIQRNDGTVTLSLFHKTSDGGTVSILLDITDQKQAEQAAARSHQRLIDAIESMPAGFRIFDADERLVLWNSKYQDQTRWHYGNIPVGITFEQILERTVRMQGLVDKAEHDDTYISKRIAEFRNPSATPYELRRSDGKIFLSIYRKTADGGTVHVMIDITELKQAEEALKASEVRLNTILDLAPEAIITIDQAYRIQMFNAGAERLFGYKADDISGQNVETLISEPDISVWQMDGRKEMTAWHENGQEFPVEISMAETIVADAPLYTMLLQDISERKRWEKELRQAMRLAEAANRAKSEFLSHMSHELRTPLNGILGYAEFIQEKWLGDDALDQYAEYAGFIHESGQHLLQLINDILDLSKIEAGHYEMLLEEIDIGDLFKECQHVVAADAEREQIAIDFNIQPGSSNWIADRRALKQILINLLSNALKFSDAGSRINVEAACDDAGHFRLDVRDTGIGMTEEESRRALEPFVQVGTPYVATQKGTGLGLALVVRFAALHGGSVDIKSTPQVGTTVHVTLPPTRDTDAATPPKQLSA